MDARQELLTLVLYYNRFHKFIFFSAPSAPPEDLIAENVSSTSFVLSWTPPPISQQNGIITKYTVNITEIEISSLTVLTSTNTSLLVLSLHPYYTYDCAVSAYTVDNGPYSEMLTITTSEDGMSHLIFCILSPIPENQPFFSQIVVPLSLMSYELPIDCQLAYVSSVLHFLVTRVWTCIK